MNRIFQITVWSAVIITIGMFVALCGYNTHVYFYNQAIYKEIKYEKITRTAKLEKEAARMRALAEKSHEKCPSQFALKAHVSKAHAPTKHAPKGHIFNDIEIPAYPHLSAIYIYIHPSVFVHQWLMNNSNYGPSYIVRHLPKEALQRTFRYSYLTNSKRHHVTASKEALFSTMPLLFIEALEQSLAYCGIDKDGNPLKVIVVNKIQHDNLEQKDALTVMFGVVLSTSTYSHEPHSAKLYTHQYIPRWNTFPETHRDDNVRGKERYSYISYDDPHFKIHDLQASRSYSPFSLLIPKEESIKEWLTNTWPNKETLKNNSSKGSPAAFIKYKVDKTITKKPFTNTYNTHHRTLVIP